MPPRKSTTGKQRRVAGSSDDDGDNQDSTDYDSDAPPRATAGAKKGTGSNKKKKTAAAKGKGKQRAQSGDDDDDGDGGEGDSDDEPVAKGKKGKLSEEERQELVGAIVRHVLFTEYTRKSHPRAAIIAAVLSKPHHKGRFTELFPFVQRKLKDTFGMELVLMRAKQDSKSAPATYALRSVIPINLIREMVAVAHPAFATEMDDEDDVPNNQLAKSLAAYAQDVEVYEEEEGAPMRDYKKEEGAVYGILGIILALILVNGQVMGDDQLITYLRRLDLVPSAVVPVTIGSAHPEASTLAKYIDELVKQGYLERGPSASAAQKAGAAARGPTATQRTQRGSGENRVEGGDPNIEYRWGARAELEIGELGVARFVATIWGKPDDEQVLAEIKRAAGTNELKGT